MEKEEWKQFYLNELNNGRIICKGNVFTFVFKKEHIDIKRFNGVWQP